MSLTSNGGDVMNAPRRGYSGRLRFCAFLLVLALTSLSGCRDINGSVGRRDALRSKSAETVGSIRESYLVTDDTIKELDLLGPVTAGPVEVFHSKDIAPLAADMAKEMQAAIAAVEEHTAVRIQYGLRIYLISVPAVPQYYDLDFKNKTRTIAFPMFVRAGAKSLEDVFADNKYASYYLIHELTEASISKPASGSPILVATRYGPLFVLHHTRWFREGLSNYAGYIATQNIVADAGPRAQVPINPGFLTLRRADGALFRWHQLGNSDADAAYYDAAFGLFLLIEKRYGKDKIREVVKSIDSAGFADGKTLTTLFSRAIGTDIEKLVRDFKFPQLGLWLTTPGYSVLPGDDHMRVLGVSPKSVAADAGFEKGDIIATVNGVSAKDFLDYDLAMLDVMDRPSVNIGVVRGGVAQVLTVSLDPRRTVPQKVTWRTPPKEAFRDFGIAVGVAFR